MLIWIILSPEVASFKLIVFFNLVTLLLGIDEELTNSGLSQKELWVKPLQPHMVFKS